MFEVRGIICAGYMLGRTRRDVLMSCLCVRVHVHVEHVRKQMQYMCNHLDNTGNHANMRGRHAKLKLAIHALRVAAGKQSVLFL